MMGRLGWVWSKRTASAMGLLISALLAFPSVAAADHPFLPQYFPPPKEKLGFPIPVPLLPEHALTGYETPNGSFKDACGLAVGGGGEIYVSDYYHDAIDLFVRIIDPKNGLRYGYQGRTLDEDANGGPCGIAISPYGLYVNDYRRGVWSYPAGPAKNIDPGPTTGVAWDPPNQRVYVTHSNFVAVYEPDGTPVLEGLEPLRIGLGTLEDAYGAAVSDFAATKGFLYVADASDETVKVFDPATSTVNPVETIDGSLGPQQGFRDLIDSALAIDPTNGNLLVSDRLARGEEPPMVIDEISPDGHFRGQLQHAIADGEPPGIGFDPFNHNVYVTTGRNAESGVYAFGPASPTHPLLVSKAGAGEGTVTSTPANISCPASCTAGEAEFNVGSTVTLKATAAAHSTFSGWTVGGQPAACLGTGPCQVLMNAATEVTAEFSPIPQENLTVTAEGDGEGTVASEPAGIECGTFCSEHFDQGSTVVLTAGPGPHSHLAGWAVEGDPSACPGTSPCELTMDQDTAVTATFAHNPDRTLSLSIDGPGRVVSSPGGIDCQSSCAHAFTDGTAVTLEAQPSPRYELLSWSGACSGKRLCVVQLSEDKAVGATFVRIEDALAVSVIGSGTGVVSDPGAGINCGLTCAGIFLRGSVLTLTAQAEKGSRFIGFAGCDSVAGAVCTVSVAEATTIIAVFGEAPEIAVRRVSVRGAVATLSVGVPGPGLLKASGRGILDTKLRARSEGVVNLPLSLSRKGRKTLRNSKEGRLSITVALVFASADGSTVKTKKVVTFKRGSGR